MSACRTVYFLIPLVFAPFLTLGQKESSTELSTRTIDLANKTFIMREVGEVGKTGNDLDLYLIFHKNGSATFRVKRSGTVIKDNPLSWRFVGDSLYIQNGSIKITAEGKTQTIDREAMKYAVEKAPDGYLLKEKDIQTFWFELK